MQSAYRFLSSINNATWTLVPFNVKKYNEALHHNGNGIIHYLLNKAQKTLITGHVGFFPSLDISGDEMNVIFKLF